MILFNFLRQGALRSAFAFLYAVFVLTLALSVNADSMDNYRLGAGDKITIAVYGEEDLSIETMLGNSGLINYPFLGEIKVTGLNVSELESRLVAGLKGDYLINPSVHVAIVEYRPFFIHGEVENPGGYPYQAGLTVSKAGALAGGFTERASMSKIYVLRGDDPTQTELRSKLNTKLRPGDIVTIQQSFF